MTNRGLHYLALALAAMMSPGADRARVINAVLRPDAAADDTGGKTSFDLDRIGKAQEKRKRKNAKRLAQNWTGQ